MELKVDVYKTEEEQVQAIKTWWKDNAFSVIAGIVIGISVLVGYRYWTDLNQTKAQQASVLYNTILTEDNKSKNTELLKNEYSATPYAALATLLVAKDLVVANEYEKAEAQLLWAIENSHDDAVKHIAQQRLARIYLSQDKISEAENLVKGIKAVGFDAAYNDIRGDIYFEKKLFVQAKEHYRLALSALSQGDQRYTVIKMKLDDLAQNASTITSEDEKANVK